MAAKKTFLGKPVPGSAPLLPANQPGPVLGALLVPLALAAGVLLALFGDFFVSVRTNPGPEPVSRSQTRVLGDAAAGTVTVTVTVLDDTGGNATGAAVSVDGTAQSYPTFSIAASQQSHTVVGSGTSTDGHLPVHCSASVVLASSGNLILKAPYQLHNEGGSCAVSFNASADTGGGTAQSTDTSTSTQTPTSGTGVCPTSDAQLTDAMGLNPSRIFPIVPDALRLSDDGSTCPPTQWNAIVIRYFVYKALTLANWLAAALAIILTILAGLYYMAGFANEANVKKGKTILTAAYAGLALVILARVFIYGSIQVFTGQNYDPSNVPSNATDYIK